ncbi:SspB-related isopeptide-forming adhesin [Leuconostoc sp. UCMA20149]|uniref:SspB-related isopeptide-forming adhesin n=1 Tax=Leuconostoc sp. UCMA20149 TaxID=2583528 RepID=UPI0025B22B20|nr:SspB-related isopeptide-forming adhesin [Leuconostoc sp. UCMA20149]
MAINIEQVKRRRTTAQPRRPNFYRLKRHHPILKTLLLALIGILIVTGAVIYGNHTQWQTAQSVQKASHKAVTKAKKQPIVKASQVKQVAAQKSVKPDYSGTGGLSSKEDMLKLAQSNQAEILRGHVAVPSFSISEPIYEGTSNHVLAIGAGMNAPNLKFGTGLVPIFAHNMGDYNAYISVGSLNAGYQSNSGNGLGNSKHVEKSKMADASLISINGGTIKAQSDGWDYADMNSWFNKDGSVFQTPFGNGNDYLPEHTWDTGTSDKRWYGTAVYKLKAGTSTITMSARTDSQAYDTNGATWWTSSTTMPFNTAPIPPVKPTPKKATYKLSELYTTPEPHKSETDDSGKDNNGQNVKPGQTLHYKLTWDLKGLEAIDVDKDTLAKGLSFMDDYDETKLDITDQTKKDFTVIDAKTQKSVMDELQHDWDIKNGKWTLKAKNVQDFLKNHAGHELTITFNPVVKKDASGTVTNTAVQNDFGQDFDTETVKNPITPDAPKPDTPDTPNTSYGEAPKGWLYGAIAAIALAGAAFGFRKPIKKWFHK